MWPTTAPSTGCRSSRHGRCRSSSSFPFAGSGPGRGQRHLSGLWWSATTGGHVGFESWLERDQVLHLDFDPSVVGIASQPFWLHWTDEAGKPASHAPDFFARRRDDLDRDRRAGPQLKARPHHTARSPGSTLPDGTHELVQVV